MELRKIIVEEPKSNVFVAVVKEDPHRSKHHDLFSVVVVEPGHYMIYPSNKLERTLPMTPQQTLGVFAGATGELIVAVTLDMCLFPRFYVTKPKTQLYVCIGNSKEDCIDKMSTVLGMECF